MATVSSIATASSRRNQDVGKVCRLPIQGSSSEHREKAPGGLGGLNLSLAQALLPVAEQRRQ